MHDTGFILNPIVSTFGWPDFLDRKNTIHNKDGLKNIINDTYSKLRLEERNLAI